jgi:hypothetical protein
VAFTAFGGDAIDNRGSGDDDLEVFLRVTSPLGRVGCVPGNHEAQCAQPGRITKDAFTARVTDRARAALGLPPPADHSSPLPPEAHCFSEAVEDVRVIGIDTTLVGSHGGYVSPAVMRFLHAELQRAREPHVVVVGHHLLHRAWEPFALPAWDDDYLVANRQEVISLLGSVPRVRAYLCGHHHASRIQRIAGRGQSGGFYHILTPSTAAFPCAARLLRVTAEGIEVESLSPRVPGLLEESREAVLSGRKARRFSLLGAERGFLDYVEGRATDRACFLPHATDAATARPTPGERRTAAVSP